MWNFSLPYKLKQLIDLVAQRNYLFSYDGKQYGPLLNVEKAIVVYTRDSRFLEDTQIRPWRFDHQATYLDFWLQLVESIKSCGVRTSSAVAVSPIFDWQHHTEDAKATSDFTERTARKRTRLGN